MWFQKKPSITEEPRPTKPIDYPDGLAVDTEDGVFFIKGCHKYKLYNDRVVRSWSFKPVRGSLVALTNFKRGGFLGFRDGSLIQNIADGKLYLISGNKRRHITSPDVFTKYGLDESEIIEVGDKEVQLHDLGGELA